MITGNNDYMPLPVLTDKGIKDIREIDFTHQLIEYRTGNRISIKGFRRTEPNKIWRMKYSDGRCQNIIHSSKMFDGSKIVKFSDFKDTPNRKNIEVYPIQYRTTLPLYPDPYVAGMFIAYGDYEDELLNLPLSVTQGNNLLAHKYDLNYAEKLGKNKVYFSWNYKPDDVCITWKEFFKDYNFFAKDRNLDDPLIPKEYEFSSLRDRRKFMSGIFDIGYDLREFKYGLGIMSKHEYRLKEIQRVLWSLGVNSIIYYDFNRYMRVNDKEYKLEVIGAHKQSNTFFYDIYHLRGNIQHQKEIVWKEPALPLYIVSTEYVGTGWMIEPILSDPHKIYLDANYLPRVSCK